MGGWFRKQGFRRGVCFEVPTAGDEPGGEADDRGAVGAASVRGRCQASSRPDVLRHQAPQRVVMGLYAKRLPDFPAALVLSCYRAPRLFIFVEVP